MGLLYIDNTLFILVRKGQKDKCSALVTRNNKIRLLEQEIMIMIKLLVHVICRDYGYNVKIRNMV